MPPIVYRLSGRQAKDLARGAQLAIVIPDPDPEDRELDPLVYALDHLDVLPEQIHRTRRMLVPVSPSLSGPRTDGLTSVIGDIVPDDAPLPDDWLIYWVAVIEVTVRGRRSTGAAKQQQWPGNWR